MKAFKVVGYIHDNSIYRPDCINKVICFTDKKKLTPIFISEEWDHQLYCSECEEPVDTNVIDPE